MKRSEKVLDAINEVLGTIISIILVPFAFVYTIFAELFKGLRHVDW